MAIDGLFLDDDLLLRYCCVVRMKERTADECKGIFLCSEISEL
jgi:hypothetical protein